MPFGPASEFSSTHQEENQMRKFHVLTAASALAFATPLMAQGIFRIPPGQMPPTGMCRIWIDGVPPGRQPAPMPCEVAARRLPINGHLIYGPRVVVYGNDGYYDNRIYQDEIRRQRELEIARERQIQIEREREWQIAQQRAIRDQEIRAREAEEARLRAQAIRDHEIREHARQDRDHDGDRDHRWNGSNDHRNDDHRDFRRGPGR
jgi:hypothetical protein